MIDLSNPEAEMFLDIDYYAKEGVPGILRNTAMRLKQNGYYTLGDFFSDLSGNELQALNILIEDVIKRGSTSVNAYQFLFILTAMLMVAQGHQACKVKHITENLKTIIGYVVDETKYRTTHSPNQMIAIRKEYDIDRKEVHAKP